jgi:dsRNA-specific ribonuclease
VYLVHDYIGREKFLTAGKRSQRTSASFLHTASISRAVHSLLCTIYINTNNAHVKRHVGHLDQALLSNLNISFVYRKKTIKTKPQLFLPHQLAQPVSQQKVDWPVPYAIERIITSPCIKMFLFQEAYRP